MIPRLVSKAFAGWRAWRHRCRVTRALPEIKELERLLAEHRRKHQPVRRLMRAQRDIIRAQLEREQGKALHERSSR